MRCPVIVVAALVSLSLVGSAHAGGPGEPDSSFWGTGWAEVSWGAGTQTTSVHSSGETGGRFVVSGNAGGAFATDVSVTSFLRDGQVDSGFGFLGTSTFTVPGASAGIAVRQVLFTEGLTVVVVGDASFGGTRKVFLAHLGPTGALDPNFGSGGIVVTTFGVSQSGAWAADAVLSVDQDEPATWITVVGWLEHQTLNRDLGVFGVFDLSDGSLYGAQVGAIPTTGERWLRIARDFDHCGYILGERDGELVVRNNTHELPGCVYEAPTAAFTLELPQAPGAQLRAAGITRIHSECCAGAWFDLAIVAWVESGLLTQPTVVFRTAGPYSELRSDWGSGGMVFVDASEGGYHGFQAVRAIPAWRSTGTSADGVFLAGTELGTGGNRDRVRLVHLTDNAGVENSGFPTAGTLGPDAARDHHVRDAAIVARGARVEVIVAATTSLDLDLTPRGFLTMNCANHCVFGDGFESGDISEWSTP